MSYDHRVALSILILTLCEELSDVHTHHVIHATFSNYFRNYVFCNLVNCIVN